MCPCLKVEAAPCQGMDFPAALPQGLIDVNSSDGCSFWVETVKTTVSISLSPWMIIWNWPQRKWRMIEVKYCTQGQSQLVAELGDSNSCLFTLKARALSDKGKGTFSASSHCGHSDWKHGLWDPDSQGSNPAFTSTNCDLNKLLNLIV